MAENIDINQVIEQCKKVLTQEYLCFDGRMSKRDFWMFMVPVLIANCIVQEGHAGLPLLSESKGAWLRAKLVKVILAVVISAILSLAGL